MTTKANILVLDDDPHFLENMNDLLGSLGYFCFLLSNSEYLFKRLEAESVDVILMDIHLPNSNGIYLLKQLKAHHVFANIPVIMLTLDPDKNLLKQCFENGAADFVNKPVDEIILQSRLENVLKVKRYQQELQTSQKCLAIILDSMEEAIVSVDHEKNIMFVNQNAERISGYSIQELLGKSFHVLFPEAKDEEILQTVSMHSPHDYELVIKHKNHRKMTTEASIMEFMLEDSMAWAIFFQEKSNQSSIVASTHSLSTKPGWHRYLSEKTQKIKALEGAFESMLQLFSQEGHQLIQELRDVSSALEGVSEDLSEEDQSQELRQKLVEVMVLSIEIWEVATQKTKIELAEESGIWKAALEGDRFRTKTLDRYLNINSLPKRPRWKSVTDTAHFVLTHCPVSLPQKVRLDAALEELKQLLLRIGS